MIIHQRITIIQTRKPVNPTVNEELQWLGTSLGLFGERDKDKSAFRVFLELLKAAKRGHPLSSDELAESLGLTRATAVHHLNNLMDAGLVVHDGKRYWLRDPRLERLLEELRRDLERNIDDLKRAAREIDETLTL
jgi:predicted transcriptional regulator